MLVCVVCVAVVCGVCGSCVWCVWQQCVVCVAALAQKLKLSTVAPPIILLRRPRVRIRQDNSRQKRRRANDVLFL